MTSIAKQNTIEALTIYHKAHVNKWEVRVTDGNVRIASWTDRFKSIFTKIFNPSINRAHWDKKAKEAITNKLCKEITLPQDSPNRTNIENKIDQLLQNINKITEDKISNSVEEIFLIDEILDLKKEEIPSSKKTVEKNKGLYSTKEIYLTPENLFENELPENEFEEISLNNQSKVGVEEKSLLKKSKFKIEEIPFEKAFDKQIDINKIKNNTKELWQFTDKNKYGLIVEILNYTQDHDLTRASKVADFTVDLIKEFALSKDEALIAAKNICFAMKEFNLDSDKAYELEKTTRNLINKKYLAKDLPLKLQLSASLALKQLIEKDPNRNRKEAIQIVIKRIDMLKEIQNKIPKDMQIDCVHEGKDYEYKVSFSKEQKEKIAESLKTQLKEPLYKKNKEMEENLKDKSNILTMTGLDHQSILDGERSSALFNKNGKIISTLNSDPQSNSLKIEEKYESNGFIEVHEEYETPENTITNPDSNIRDIPESLLETNFLNPLKNFQKISKLNDKNITDISHFLSQTTLGTLCQFELAELKSHVQGASSNKRGKTFYDADFLTKKTKEGNTRIILKATKYDDGDSLVININDSKNSYAKRLPINEFFNYEKDGKAGPEKFRQKMNVDFEIQINQNDEIQIRVIDAGLINKFSIDYKTLDTTPIAEFF